MFKSLRNRLILSHVLPLVVVLPLLGIAMVYILETQLLLPELTKQLSSDARFIAEVASVELDAWQKSDSADLFLSAINPNSNARAMLFDADGILLASTSASDVDLIGQRYTLPVIAQALQGQSVEVVRYSTSLDAEVIDVSVPVETANGNLLGAVRMTYQLSGIYQEVLEFRYLILVIFLLSLAGGALVGIVLAVTINRPILRAARGVENLAHGDLGIPLKEDGPEELRILVQSVNSLAARLRELEQSRRQLLSNLVHELGRPLGALRAAISAMLKGAGQEDPELAREYLEGMDGEAVRLQHLLNDLAHIQEQVLGTLELNRQPIDLHAWLKSVLLSWQAAAEEKKLKWEIYIPSDLPVVKVDPDRLAQALGNLVSNAIKFTQAGGLVETSAGVRGGEVWIAVRDTGPGIPAPDVDHIFEPFFRGQAGGRVPQGMGLGLGITRELILAHGGRLEVDSEIEHGSRFVIWLPSRSL
jgi:signal transduction histidine kinase